MKNVFLKNWLGLLLGIIALIVRILTPPQYIETFYSRGVFVGIRWIFDHSLAFSPVALLLVFYGSVLFFVYKFIKFLFSKRLPIGKRLREAGRRLLNFAGFAWFLFLILWGFNYVRPSFSKQIGLKIEKLDIAALQHELEIAAAEAVAARQILTADSLSNWQLPDGFEEKTRRDVTIFLEKSKFSAGGNLRGRQIKPDGLLFRFGLAGIYMPFTGESSIDGGLHSLEKPFSMAHELAHGYGWTDEATANFVAFLACRESPDAFTRYSGAMSYYRYVASNFRRVTPEDYAKFQTNLPDSLRFKVKMIDYKQFRADLPKGFQADLEAINQRLTRYPSWFDTAFLNDFYLKSQGVTEGVASYSRIVVLVYSWRKTAR